MTDERTDAIRCDSVDSTKRRVCLMYFVVQIAAQFDNNFTL